MKREEFQPKILIADDDQSMRDIMATAIQSIHCPDPCIVKDGQEAIERLADTTFDLLILDVMMPHVSGLEVCKHFKQSKVGQVTPVLIVTARDSVQDKVGALDDGADDYITKPFNFSELQARIRALLRVREVNIILQEKNIELEKLQAELVEKERQLAVSELAGAAAHTLGQPLSAILLNLHLLKQISQEDAKWLQAYTAIKSDLDRAIELVSQLKNSNAQKKLEYFKDLSILALD